jgi:hypothetical protein
MSILSSALDLICTGLRAQGLSVKVGAPHGEVDVALWPYYLVEPPALRGAPLDDGRSEPGYPDPLPRLLELHFLLICPDREDAVSNLIQARAVLSATPVLTVGGATVQLLPAHLPTTELAALFTAAGIPLSLSSAYLMRPVA